MLMARIKYLDPADIEDLADRELLARRPINLTRLLIRNPGLVRGMQGLSGYVRGNSQLDPRIREIGVLTVAWVARNQYEWSHHIRIARDAGVTDKEIGAIMGRSEPEGLLAAVIQGAREMYLEGGMSAATFSKLQSEVAESPLIDLIFSISFYCGIGRLLRTLEIDVEEDYMVELQQYPLPNGKIDAIP